MNECATSYERVRATRVEVARLAALVYREPLTEWQKVMIAWLFEQHVKTLPEADRVALAEQELNELAGLDWSILDEPAIPAIIRAAVLDTVENYPDKLSATVDDLTQSARIILAERATLVREKLAKGEPFLRRWLRDRLGDLVRRERRHASLDDWIDNGFER